WTVGTVALAATPTLTITVTVAAANQIVNSATVDGDQFDPNPGNNTVSTTATPQVADLALAKGVSAATPNVGDQITFTITLSNTGPDTATTVVLTDLLPAGLTFVSAVPSLGDYASASGVWTVGDVVSSASPTLILVARVDSPAPRTNTATISHSDQFDPD